ncbi:hypothetical protein [Chthoniobacter flavus]|uniref:hypothetical protein n=1 Tax=Chthoniobacter flavus TaxID=191863 RepID=UPI001046FE50|nr:hypothetical protein [Chthoniobacter flavus]
MTPEIVRSVPGTPPRLRHPDPGPGERCYFWDKQAQFLILGTVGGAGQFIPDQPRTGIDLKAHGWPISQHHPLYEESRYRVSGPPTLEKLGLKRPTLREMGMTPPPAGWKNVYTDPRGNVFEQTYDAKTDTLRIGRRPEPVPGAIPGHKYYKLQSDFLILGTIDNSGAFIPDEPLQTIDVGNQFPASLAYPYLPGTTVRTRSYTDPEGNQVDEIYDFATGTFQSRIRPKK